MSIEISMTFYVHNLPNLKISKFSTNTKVFTSFEYYTAHFCFDTEDQSVSSFSEGWLLS